MNDVEIIKALECCFAKNIVCKECPYCGIYNCPQNLGKDTIDLINRQKAEIERLKKAENFEHNVTKLFDRYKAHIKAEAIKEFAERLKAKKYIHFCKSGERVDLTDVFNGYIDNLVKEMVGEHNDN